MKLPPNPSRDYLLLAQWYGAYQKEKVAKGLFHTYLRECIEAMVSYVDRRDRVEGY